MLCSHRQQTTPWNGCCQEESGNNGVAAEPPEAATKPPQAVLVVGERGAGMLDSVRTGWKSVLERVWGGGAKALLLRNLFTRGE
jgi:hypothetical protein